MELLLLSPPMFPMAGFRRTNIQGHTVVADPELVRILRRQSSTLLGRLFREAQEHGQSHVQLNEQRHNIICHPDRTFTIVPVTETHGLL